MVGFHLHFRANRIGPLFLESFETHNTSNFKAASIIPLCTLGSSRHAVREIALNVRNLPRAKGYGCFCPSTPNTPASPRTATTRKLARSGRARERCAPHLCPAQISARPRGATSSRLRASPPCTSGPVVGDDGHHATSTSIEAGRLLPGCVHSSCY